MTGVTTGVISEILGHKTLQMVKRYSHFADQYTAEVLERMNDKLLNGITEN